MTIDQDLLIVGARVCSWCFGILCALNFDVDIAFVVASELDPIK